MISNCLMRCGCQAAQEIGFAVVKNHTEMAVKESRFLDGPFTPMTLNKHTQLLPFSGHCAHHWGPSSEPNEEKAAQTQQSAAKSSINGTSHGGGQETDIRGDGTCPSAETEIQFESLCQEKMKNIS